MVTSARYVPDQPGDWGAPYVSSGEYGTSKVVMPDGTALFARFWLQPRADEPVLVILHGLGAHSGWFIDMASSLYARGLTVYAVDHRGFGRSDGPRGHIRRGRMFLEDIRTFLEYIEQRHSGAPLFVLGHSMGGIFTVHLAAEAQARGLNALRGIVLMNPWVKDQGTTGALTQLRIVGGGMIGSGRTWRVAGGPEVMTTTSDAVSMLQADPFWVRSQSASLLYQITLLRTGMLRKARVVRVPALVLQSERDLAVVPLETRRCYETLGSAEKTWITYPDYSHDCEFEMDRERLDNDIAVWIREQASR